MMHGDGIYTKYLGRHLKPGLYQITIEVDDNNLKAFYILPNTEALPARHDSDKLSDIFYESQASRHCCGSSTTTHLDSKDLKKMGVFQRTVQGPSFSINSNPNTLHDSVAPSKIGDLLIQNLVQDRFLATWTAPGGDSDMGSVASYRFVFSPNIQDLLDPVKGQPEVLLGFDRLERAGTKAQFDFNFPHYDKDYYVGIYAFDIAGN